MRMTDSQFDELLIELRKMKDERDELTHALLDERSNNAELQAINDRLCKELNDTSNSLKHARNDSYERLQKINSLTEECVRLSKKYESALVAWVAHDDQRIKQLTDVRASLKHEKKCNAELAKTNVELNIKKSQQSSDSYATGVNTERQRCINIVRAFIGLHKSAANFQRTIERNEDDAKINDDRKDTAFEILTHIIRG